MSVHTFTRSDHEILQELLNVFSSGGGTAREQWAMQAEMLVEPIGWDALWKLSKKFCKRFSARFPCVAYVTVTSVDFENLLSCVDVLSVQHESVTLPESVVDVPLIDLWPTLKQREQCINSTTTAEFIDLLRLHVAYVTVTSVDFENLSSCVDVLSVQHESVTLPESVVDVPLIDLWPTLKQREQCINSTTTADFIDLLRFYYTEIWMPWDDQDDKVLLPNTIEDRMQLWSEIQTGTIHHSVARSVVLLRNSAIDAHERLQVLDSSLSEDDMADDDDSLLPPNYLAHCAELNAKLDGIMAKWTLYENSLIREQYLTKLRNKWTRQKGMNHLVAVWRGGNFEELNRINEYVKIRASDKTVTVVTTAEEGLAMEPDELVVCSKTCEMPEVSIMQTSITSFLPNARLSSDEMRSCLLMLSGHCQISQLTLQCSQVNTAVLMRSGTLHMNNCTVIDGDSLQSDFAQGLVAMSGAKILIENCTITNLYSGIVVHKGAELELRGCKIKNCGVGIQMYSGSRVELNNTIITECSENSIRCEVDPGTARKYTEVEGLQIHPNSNIGTGNLETEILIVQQEQNLM